MYNSIFLSPNNVIIHTCKIERVCFFLTVQILLATVFDHKILLINNEL